MAAIATTGLTEQCGGVTAINDHDRSRTERFIHDRAGTERSTLDPSVFMTVGLR